MSEGMPKTMRTVALDRFREAETLRVHVARTFWLADAAGAHRAEGELLALRIATER